MEIKKWILPKNKNELFKKTGYECDISKSYIDDKDPYKKCIHVPVVFFDEFCLDPIWLSEEKEFKDKWPGLNFSGEWDVVINDEGKIKEILFFCKK